jgi:hypothetical protein
MLQPARRTLAVAAGALLALTACDRPSPPAHPVAATDDPATAAAAAAAARESAREKEVLEAAVEAYVYGYPLVSMELTRRAQTNVARPTGDRLAPMGQLARQRALPTPADREATAPDADTLSVQAWIDVSAEPWVVSLPDTRGRYLLLSLHSGWTDAFAMPGARTTGTRAQRLAITGPGWKGKLPASVTELKSPTGLVWLRGRIATTGTARDLAEVYALQDQLELAPLSSLGKRRPAPVVRPDPAVDMKTPTRDQVQALDAMAYFRLLAAALKTNPPAAADAAPRAALARIGLVPGKDFDGASLDAVAMRSLAGAPSVALARIAAQGERSRASVNGWLVRVGGVGAYGTDYLQRASLASEELGASRLQDLVTLVAEADADGAPLDGSKRHRLRFPRGQLPPATAYWSLTLHDGRRDLAVNKLNRRALGSRDRLRFEKDGSLELVIQKDPPVKGQEANWLPAPAGPFALTLAIAWPREKPPTVLDGTWKPPAITPAK